MAPVMPVIKVSPNLMNILLALLIALLTCFSSPIFSQHVHGSATGSFIAEQNHISLELIFPSQSLVGFEHSAQTAAEKRLVNQTIEILKETAFVSFFRSQGRFFTTTKRVTPTNKACSVTIVPLNNPSVSTKHSAHAAHSDHHHHHDQNTHTEFRLTCSYQLHSAAPLSELEFTIFDTFLELEELNLSVMNHDYLKTLKFTKRYSRHPINETL